MKTSSRSKPGERRQRTRETCGDRQRMGGARGKAHRASRDDLILENVLSLSVELFRKRIDALGLVGCGFGITKHAFDCLRDECRTVRGHVIDLLYEIVRK